MSFEISGTFQLDKGMRKSMFEKLPIDNPTSETVLALDAAKKASQEIMQVYNSIFGSTKKADNEPITEADIKSNKIILDELSQTNIPILSEESPDDKKRLDSNKVWIVDPLDGTSDFVNHTGEFTVMIALVQNKKPILGVIYQPVTDTVYFAQKGKGAFQMESGKWQTLSVSDVFNISQFRVVGSRFHLSNIERQFLDKLNTASFVSRGSSLKAADISSGKAELYLTTSDKIKQWDTCASYCLVAEAGGKMTDMNGNDIEYNTKSVQHKNGIIISNGTIHENILDDFRRFQQENFISE